MTAAGYPPPVGGEQKPGGLTDRIFTSCAAAVTVLACLAFAANVLRDLSDVLALVNPDTVYVTAPGDCHGDHDALGRFTTQAVAAMENPPALYYYLIHADRTDIWPERDAERFRLPPMAADHPLLRCAAERRPLPDGFPPAEKYSLIQSYTSQDPAAYNGYLLAFAKNDELVFRVERLPSRT